MTDKNPCLLEINLLIVGSGPAGCTAALYAARAGLKPTLVKGPEPGGQLTITTDVENFPGFLNVQGPDLMEKMEHQVKEAGTQLVQDRITDVAFHKTQHNTPTHHTLYGIHHTYQAKAVILATGASAKWLDLPSEKHFRGFGVSACATCDAPFFRNKDVAVIGGGNTAVEEALHLTHHAKHVYLVHRRDTLRAEHVLQERLQKNPNVTILWNHVLTEVRGEDRPHKHVQAARLRHTKTHKEKALEVSGIFIAIGHKPNTDFVKSHLRTDNEGYIIGTSPGMHTEIPGVFTAGDVRDKIYRQAVTAAGQGCMAALDAARYLSTI